MHENLQFEVKFLIRQAKFQHENSTKTPDFEKNNC